MIEYIAEMWARRRGGLNSPYEFNYLFIAEAETGKEGLKLAEAEAAKQNKADTNFWHKVRTFKPLDA